MNKYKPQIVMPIEEEDPNVRDNPINVQISGFVKQAQ